MMFFLKQNTTKNPPEGGVEAIEVEGSLKCLGAYANQPIAKGFVKTQPIASVIAAIQGADSRFTSRDVGCTKRVC